MIGKRYKLEEIQALHDARVARAKARVAKTEEAARLARAGAPPAADDAEWLPIPGFGGAYEIHRDGRVRSWKAWMGATLPLPRAMKVQTTRKGGRVIQLGLHGGTHKVAELVAEIFQKPLEGPYIFSCGCSRRKVLLGMCDLFNPDGSERE